MSTAEPLFNLPAKSALTSARFNEIRESLYQTSQKPKPADWKESQAWTMSVVHLFMIDMVIRVYSVNSHLLDPSVGNVMELMSQFAEEAVEKDDLINYLGFADMAFAQICHHHHFEEEIIFPMTEKVTGNDLMSANVVQHHAFAPQLDQTWQYVRQCRRIINPLLVPPVKEVIPEVEAVDLSGTDLDPSQGFNPRKLQKHMESFVPLLAEHLYDEISTLSPENYASFGEKEQKEMDKIVESHLRSYDPTWFLCSSLAMMPMSNVKQLIGLPTPVRRVIVPFVFARKHASIWPYCSHPENLTFWGSA